MTSLPCTGQATADAAGSVHVDMSHNSGRPPAAGTLACRCSQTRTSLSLLGKEILEEKGKLLRARQTIHPLY